MKNLKIYLPLVDGGLLPMEFYSGKELIHELITDDFGAPPTSLVFEAKTKDDKTIKISIPYSDENEVLVYIENE